jgi:DNA-binding NtrC family response regulator
MYGPKILVVEDDSAIRISIGEYLVASNFQVLEAESCKQAEEIIRATLVDAAILDYGLPDGTGLDLLSRLKQADRLIPTVILTGQGSIELAVQAIKEGAEHLLTKPVQLAALVVLLRRILDNQRANLKERANQTRRSRERINPFIGTSPAICHLAEQARKVAAGDSPVLIQGETGSGKGVLARWLHENSTRREDPFVDLNCAGLSRDLLESDLFGHEKGAFTSAVSSKPGLFEIAHRGTFFLDEIGDLDLSIQPKLLKVVEDKLFRRVGSTTERRVDVRLIAASHESLRELVKQKRFRQDLYFRISAIPLRVPPLRERAEDIPFLAQLLLQNVALELGRSECRLGPDAVQALMAYSWPGNIRELRNVLERAVLLSSNALLKRVDLLLDDSAHQGGWLAQTNLTLEQLETAYILRVLEEEKSNVGRAALRLGVPRSSLYNKLKIHRLNSTRLRVEELPSSPPGS